MISFYKKYFKRFSKKDDGVAAVEFALIAPILLTILMGVVDYGMFIQQKINIENLARSSAEYVRQGGDETNIMADVILQSDYLTDEGQAQTLDTVSFVTEELCECAGGVAVACDAASSCGSSDYKRHFFSVEITKNYQTIFPYPGMPSSISLTGHSRLQVE